MDKKIREEMILQHAPLVNKIVRRMVTKLPLAQNDREDLINVGIIGLIDALDRYDAGRNVRFETYATYRIRGAVLDELRARDWLPRSARARDNRLEDAHLNLQKKLGRAPEEEEIAAYLGITLEEYYRHLDEVRTNSIIGYEDIDPDFLEVYNQHELLAAVDKENPFTLVANGQLREMIVKAIGRLPEKERLVLSLYYSEELTMKEIGLVWGVTESRVCQLHGQALIRMRGELQEEKQGRAYAYPR